MLTAWPNIRKSLLHLMLLAELFREGRAGKTAMLPWASGWSSREISHRWLRDAGKKPDPLHRLSLLLPPCCEWPGKLPASVKNQKFAQEGPFLDGIPKRAHFIFRLWGQSMGRVSGQPLKVSCMPERHFPEGGIAFISPHFVVYLGQFYFCCIDTTSRTCPFGVLSLHTFGRWRNRSLDLCLTAVLKCSGDRYSSHSPGRGDPTRLCLC